MKNLNLNPEEQELLETFEAGEFQSTMTPARKKLIEESAAQMCKNAKSSWLVNRDEKR